MVLLSVIDFFIPFSKLFIWMILEAGEIEDIYSFAFEGMDLGVYFLLMKS